MGTQRQKSLNIIVLGDACIDKYHYGYCERLSPEAPVPVLRHDHTEERDGMCLNVANNMIALGCRTTKVYNSELIYKERFVDIKTHQHLLRSDFGENSSIQPLSKTQIKDLPIADADALVISDYDKGFITAANAITLARLCAQHDVPLFVDSKKKDLRCFEDATLKINQKEFAEAVHYPTNYELVVTLGSDGARWNDKTYPTNKCDVFDVSGAGDTFLAALVCEYLHTNSYEKAVRFANKCSRIVVQKFGTYCLHKDDLK